MSFYIVVFLIILMGVLLWLVFDLRKNFQQDSSNNEEKEKMIMMMERLAVLAEQNERLRNIVDSKLSETHKTTQESLSSNSVFMQKMHSQSVAQIREITEKLSKLEETNKQVMGFSEQLRGLEDILKNPKQRGILGEYFLEDTLKNVLPPGSYQMQYEFSDGDIVDAIVRVKDKIVPIDSKFSLENYQRILDCKDEAGKESLEKLFKQDLKNRIDETSKYIKPAEGTMDFAFMFIPSEAIYYDLLVNKVGTVKIDTRSMIEYAFRDKHVIIVSPTSFLAYLQTVLQGLRAMQIEDSAKEIRSNVEKLGGHIIKFNQYYEKLGNSLKTTINHFNVGHRELGKIEKDVVRISGGDRTIEPMVLEKPDNL